MNESPNIHDNQGDEIQAKRHHGRVSFDDVFAMDEVFISPAGLIGRALCKYLEENCNVVIGGFIDQQGTVYNYIKKFS